MKFQFFSIKALDQGQDQEALNRFCEGHRLISIEKHFVPAGLDSFWVFCIQYVDQGQPTGHAPKNKIDYREVLSEEDFAVYSKLRSLRKTLADQEGVPVYSVFTNEQLATMVRERIGSATAMLGIAGVGKARVEKYGGDFIPLLKNEFADDKDHETNQN